jgi:hypothetical protein
LAEHKAFKVEGRSNVMRDVSSKGLPLIISVELHVDRILALLNFLLEPSKRKQALFSILNHVLQKMFTQLAKPMTYCILQENANPLRN